MFRKLLFALCLLFLAGPAATQSCAAGKSAPAARKAAAKSPTVYITRTGKKYHSAGCSSLRKSSSAISLKNAQARGYDACSRCGGVPDEPEPAAEPERPHLGFTPSRPQPKPGDGVDWFRWAMEQGDVWSSTVLKHLKKPSARIGKQREECNGRVALYVKGTTMSLNALRSNLKKDGSDKKRLPGDLRHALHAFQVYADAGQYMKSFMATGDPSWLTKVEEAQVKGRADLKRFNEIIESPIPAEEL